MKTKLTAKQKVQALFPETAVTSYGQNGKVVVWENKYGHLTYLGQGRTPKHAWNDTIRVIRNIVNQ